MRKGVSPIVSSLLVTIIIIVIGVAVFAWAMNVLNLSGESMFSIITFSSEKMKEDIVIEHVTFYYSNNSITLYIRNIGDIEVKIVDFFIQDLNSSSELEHVSLSDRNIILLIDEFEAVNIRVSTSLVWGDIYMIKIVSDRGNSFMIKVKAT